ncbi:MAG TPA: hypothetical protein VG406_00350 [Isosphaeraceae bacterium]|jgi:hypothetical protein|nr:hypothetical protein [Isosphaeraceae bacterium]
MHLETWERVKDALVVAPILLLLALGTWLTLRSGLVGLGTGPRLRRLAENLSHTVLYVVGGSAVLAVLQWIAGFSMALAW